MGLSNELSCELGSFSCCLNSHRFFSVRGLRLYFPELVPWVVGLSRSPVVPPVYLHVNVGPPVLQPPCCLESSLPGCLSPPLLLSGCFFFISLVVGLPYSSIFCQFCLFFVFKLLSSFFWLCEEAPCVYICLHLGRKPPNMII